MHINVAGVCKSLHPPKTAIKKIFLCQSCKLFIYSLNVPLIHLHSSYRTDSITVSKKTNPTDHHHVSLVSRSMIHGVIWWVVRGCGMHRVHVMVLVIVLHLPAFEKKQRRGL